MPKSNYTPDGLPIGFAKDREFVGLICSACHTSQLQIAGKKVIVEGGQAMIDFEAFVAEFVNALKATQDDIAKFDRFASKVIGPNPMAAQKADLRNQFAAEYEDLRVRTEQNKPRHPGGPGRVDAFGHIFNRLTSQILQDKQGKPMHENAVPPPAPVSYPVLWDTPQHDRVQWNGSAANEPKQIGPISRNVGECIGVFGRMKITGPVPPNGYESSIDRAGLNQLEDMVRTLWSPKWPYAVDSERSKACQKLYEARCAGCHAIIPRDGDDAARQIVAKVTSAPGTDATMWRAF